MSRSVLLIEDDPRVRRALELGLRDEGYLVTQASTGREGLVALSAAPHDVVLLDLVLPDLDGFTVCRSIRHDSDVPIIMVTARTDSHDVVAGLEAGADDYVTKPFVAKELSARIRALLRRVEPSRSKRAFECGDLSIRLDLGTVQRAGRQLHLTRTEFRLLAELALAGEVCTRADLLHRVWGYEYLGDSRLVDVHVRRLRSKIESDPANPRLLITVRGQGYRLAVDP